MSKAKVCMLTHDRRIDRRIILQAESLEKVGYEVTIIGMPVSGIKDTYHRVKRIGGNETAKLSLISSIKKGIKASLKPNTRLYRLIRQFTLCYLIDPENYFVNLFYDTAVAEKSDIYVAHDLPLLAAAHRCAKVNNAKLVYDNHELFHEQEFSKPECELWRRIERKFIHDCDAVMTVNQSIAEVIENMYQLPKVHVIRNAVFEYQGESKKHFHQAFNLPNDVKIVLYQGGLTPNRNLMNLVRSVKFYQHDNTHLVFMGEGCESERLQSLVKKLQLQDRIHFHPHVAQDKLLAFTNSADVGLIPYQTTCLNTTLCSPNKLYEFVAAHLPIIATDLIELNAVVVGNNIGLVGDTTTAEMIADLVNRFFSNADTINTYQKNVAQLAKSLNWEQEAVRLTAIYEPLSSDRKIDKMIEIEVCHPAA